MLLMEDEVFYATTDIGEESWVIDKGKIKEIEYIHLNPEEYKINISIYSGKNDLLISKIDSFFVSCSQEDLLEKLKNNFNVLLLPETTKTITNTTEIDKEIKQFTSLCLGQYIYYCNPYKYPFDIGKGRIRKITYSHTANARYSIEGQSGGASDYTMVELPIEWVYESFTELEERGGINLQQFIMNKFKKKISKYQDGDLGKY